MTDLLSIATYAGLQTMNIDMLDSFEAEYAIAGPDAWMVSLHNVTYRMAESVTSTNQVPVFPSSTGEVIDFDTPADDYIPTDYPSRSAQILAEMRADNRAAIESFTADVDDKVEAKGKRMRRNGVIRASGPRYQLATSAGRRNALATSQLTLEGTEFYNDRNQRMREFRMPARAMSYCGKQRNRVDSIEKLFAFFSNPTEMAITILGASLPQIPDTAYLVNYLADNGIYATPADIKALKLVNADRRTSWTMGRLGGRTTQTPGRVRIADGVTPPTVDAKRRGRPSGPKYVEYLRPTSDTITAASLLLTGPRPMYGPEYLPIPGGNDVAQGTQARRRMTETD